MAKRDDKKPDYKIGIKNSERQISLEEENRCLKQEIKDMRANLKINKEIIEELFTKTKTDKSNFYTLKLREENSRLLASLESITNEKEEMKVKLNHLESTISEAFVREQEENEKLKNKVFFMENVLIKKDNIISGNKKKEKPNDERAEKEIYVIEPSAAINMINDELLMYKEIYGNLITHVKQNRDSIIRYELLLNDLQNENAKLRTQIKLSTISIASEKEKELISALTKEREREREEMTSIKNRVAKEVKQNIEAENRFQNNDNNAPLPSFDRSRLKNKLSINDDLFLFTGRKNTSNIFNNVLHTQGNTTRNRQHESEEWLEILRYNHLSPDELDRLSRNPMCSNLVESIELMSRLVCDKNFQIRLLESENDNLNQKTFNQNKELEELKEQFQLVNEELNIYRKHKKRNNEPKDNSMINNTSKIKDKRKIKSISPKDKIFLDLQRKYEVNGNNYYEKIKENVEEGGINHIKNSATIQNDSNTDSVVYKEYNRMTQNEDIEKYGKEALNTLESCNSIEFRNGISEFEQDHKFMTYNVDYLNFDIKYSNI